MKGAEMKRKVLLVSMAMLTGMPGWALAKGNWKMDDIGARPMQSYLGDSPFGQEPQGDARNSLWTMEMLAKVKSMLQQQEGAGAAGMPARHRPRGWSMELMGAGSLEGGNGTPLNLSGHEDPRIRAAKPIGLAWRLKF